MVGVSRGASVEKPPPVTPDFPSRSGHGGWFLPKVQRLHLWVSGDVSVFRSGEGMVEFRIHSAPGCLALYVIRGAWAGGWDLVFK